MTIQICLCQAHLAMLVSVAAELAKTGHITTAITQAPTTTATGQVTV